MSDLTYTATLVAKSFDTNHNNQVQDDLTFSSATLAKVDKDKNGQVSVTELAVAIETDQVIISNGQATTPKGKVKIANLLGGNDALGNANSALVQAQEQLQPLQKWDSGRKNMITNLNTSNKKLDLYIQLFDANLTLLRRSGVRKSDDTYQRVIESRQRAEQLKAENNAIIRNLSGMSPLPWKPRCRAKPERSMTSESRASAPARAKSRR